MNPYINCYISYFPKNVEIKLFDNKLNSSTNYFLVKGPLGELKIGVNLHTKAFILKNNQIIIFYPKGFFNSLLWLNRIFWGLCRKYKRTLEIIGTGYKCIFDKELRILTFYLGYSHLIKLKLHSDIDCKIVKKEKILRFKSANWLELYNALFIIKTFRKINIFKGKGIKLKTEFIKLKTGKKKR